MPTRSKRLSRLACPLVLALAVAGTACSASRSTGAARAPGRPPTSSTPSTSNVSTPQPPSDTPAGTGDGGPPDGTAETPVTVPAGVTAPGAVVDALEAQRGGRPVALYWRHLLLHGAPTDAYLYINDLARTDLGADVRNPAADKALAALTLTETWSSGDARPELPNFESVAHELTTRATTAASIEVLASNAARSTEDPNLIDALIVYRPIYPDGSSDRTNRLVVVLNATLDITNAYYF